MQYPLPEKIGVPELLVGREQEFENFGKWLQNIPRRLSKSRVILARRKSGKTVFVQRIFNQLWSEHGEVIPFYLDIGETNIWLPDFALKYFEVFATQYISFLERDEKLVSERLTLEQIYAYGLAKGIKLLVDNVDSLRHDKAEGNHNLMWDTACSAPHRFANYYDQRFLVILDEFQHIAKYIYPDPYFQAEPIESMPGSFHSHAESKIAPMLVTGSYVGWLLSIIDEYLEAGRLSRIFLSPYLTQEAGLEAVYRYAEVYEEPITNETAIQINELCMADPFFISCVLQSQFEKRDLTQSTGVIETVNYELADRLSEMSLTWGEYIDSTLKRVNDRNAKSLLLFLNKYNQQYWTARELKEKLQLDLEVNDIQSRLLTLVESDLLTRGSSDIQFRGLQDGTLNLILRNRFEQEINDFVPDIKQEFQVMVTKLRSEKRQLQGMLNHLAGKLAEHLLATEFRSRKRFRLSEYFEGVRDDRELNLIDVKERVTLQRSDGKGQEFDLLAQSSDGRVVLVEVRKRQEKSTLKDVEDFRDKYAVYAGTVAGQAVLPAFLSLGGFTDEAQSFCQNEGIATAEQITYVWNQA